MSSQKWQENVKMYAERHKLYEKLKAKLERDLSDICSKVSMHAIVQARSKSISSFAEKLSRKAQANPCEDYTDLCAGRIITRTGNEVSTISKEVEKKYEKAIDWPNSVDHTKLLKTREFGYRSIHYIITIDTSQFDDKNLRDMSNPRVEVQVRTLLEHAWSDIDHEYVYKPSFPTPELWQRESSRSAALLENVDATFNRMQVGLKRYKLSYGAYLDPHKILEELRKLGFILNTVVDKLERQEHVNVAVMFGRLSAELDDGKYWATAAKHITDFIISSDTFEEGDWPLYLLRGILTCRNHDPKEVGFNDGLNDLKKASKLAPSDVEALVTLADTYELLAEYPEQQVQEQQRFENIARQKYKEGYALDPSDPRVLASHLCWEVKFNKSSDIIHYLRPSIMEAIQRSQEEIKLKIFLPSALYHEGLLYLLLNDNDCLFAYSEAIKKTTSRHILEMNIRSLERLESIQSEILHYSKIKEDLEVALERLSV